MGKWLMDECTSVKPYLPISKACRHRAHQAAAALTIEAFMFQNNSYLFFDLAHFWGQNRKKSSPPQFSSFSVLGISSKINSLQKKLFIWYSKHRFDIISIAYFQNIVSMNGLFLVKINNYSVKKKNRVFSAWNHKVIIDHEKSVR